MRHQKILTHTCNLFQGDAYLVEYLLHFLSKFQPVSKEHHDDLLKKFISVLTHRNVTIRNKETYTGTLRKILFL